MIDLIKRLKNKLIILQVVTMCMAVFCVAGCGNNSSPETKVTTPPRAHPVPEGPHPRLELAVDSFDFGRLTAGDVLEKRIEFRNIGDEPLAISKAMGVGSQIRVTYPEDPIAPGTAGELVIRYDTADRSGLQRRRVVIMSNDPVTPRQYINFTADVDLVLGARPRRVWFGHAASIEPVEETFKLVGSMLKAVNPRELRFETQQLNEAVDFRIEDSRKEGGGITVHVRLDTPSMEPGQFNIPVTVHHNLAAAGPVNVILNGRITGPLASDPARVYFGHYVPGTPMTQIVTVRHRRDKPFTVTGADTNNPQFSVTNIPDDHATAVGLEIRFLAEEKNPFRTRGILTVHTDLPEHGTLDIPLYAFRDLEKK